MVFTGRIFGLPFTEKLHSVEVRVDPRGNKENPTGGILEFLSFRLIETLYNSIRL